MINRHVGGNPGPNGSRASGRDKAYSDRTCGISCSRSILNALESTEVSRAHLLLFLFLSGVVATAQTASDLAARYGNPDAEQFTARSGITLMARYAEDRAACEILIEPEQSIQQPADKELSMPTDTVSTIIDELIPVSERGILLSHSIEFTGAPEYDTAEYKNVKISRYYLRNLPADHDEKSASVVRKDGPCDPANAPQGRVPAIALTATDLRTRYGDSRAQRFMVRPGITLMVTYGTDQASCRMVLGPTRSILPREEPVQYMRSGDVTGIIDEVLTDADRGKQLRRVVTRSGCNGYETIDYDNVTVSRFSHGCDLPKPEMEGEATVMRKNPACSKGAK